MSEAPQRGRIHIGISGWRYAAWRGKFYPAGVAQRRELEFAAKTFSSVEINGTFYSLQRPSSFEQWSSEAPEGFVFAVKGGRFITHMKKLTGVDTALAVRNAVDYLSLNHHLTRAEALAYLSASADFDVSQVVDRTKGLHALIPRVTSTPNGKCASCQARLY